MTPLEVRAKRSARRSRRLAGLVLAIALALTAALWWIVRRELQVEAHHQLLPLALLAGGALISVLASVTTWTLADARARAIRLSEKMTVEMRGLALVASHTANAVSLADAEWQIEWVNDSFVRLTGYTLDEIKGQPPSAMLTGPETDPRTVQAIADADAAGQPFKGELLCYAKDGRKYWCELEIQALRNEESRLVGYMAMQLDITDRKRAEEKLRAATEAAERANRAKSAFLAMMSHEIRTPMNGVIGMTGLLLETALTREQQEFVETIRLSGDSLLTIINDILDYSKIESGKMELENAPFMLRECVEGALDLLAVKAAEKGIDLLYEINDGVPGTIAGDATRLRQILVNLLGNAVKFTERGEVALTVALAPDEGAPPPAGPGPADAASPTGAPRPVALLFSVRDTGIGIALEAIDRLFQSFTQVDASTTRRYGGTGLGLAISRRLTELMGGRMVVESEVGRGSTFSLVLPVQAVASKPRPYQQPGVVRLDGLRVLLVDDNPTNCRILDGLALRWGMKPRTTQSGDEALGWIQAGEPFEVAILDMHMPGRDGVALGRAIREHRNAAQLPLVLLSSIGGREVGPGDLFAVALTKPVKPNQLFDALAGLFPRSRAPFGIEEMPAPVAAATTAGPEGARILLAEDNIVNQKVALAMLGRMGLRADVAATGKEVLAAVGQQRYDIILMDVQMPEMDGFEATQQLLKLWPDPAQRPWIVAVTANAMAGDRELCLAAGMDAYLTKPINKQDLAEAIENAGRQRPPPNGPASPGRPYEPKT